MSLISKAFAFVTGASPAKADAAPDTFNDDMANNNSLPVQANTNMTPEDGRQAETSRVTTSRVTRQSKIRSNDRKTSSSISDMTHKSTQKSNKLLNKSNEKSPNQKNLTDFFHVQNKSDGKELENQKTNPYQHKLGVYNLHSAATNEMAKSNAHAKLKVDIENRKGKSMQIEGKNPHDQLFSKDGKKRVKPRKFSPSVCTTGVINPLSKKKLTKSSPSTPISREYCHRKTRSTPVTPDTDKSEVQTSKHPSMHTDEHMTRSTQSTPTSAHKQGINKEINKKAPTPKIDAIIGNEENVGEKPASGTSKCSTRRFPGVSSESPLSRKARSLPSTSKSDSQAVEKKENVDPLPNAENRANNSSRKSTRHLPAKPPTVGICTRKNRNKSGTSRTNTHAIEKEENVASLKNLSEKLVSLTEESARHLPPTPSKNPCTRKTRSMSSSPSHRQSTDNKIPTTSSGTDLKEQQIIPSKINMCVHSTEFAGKSPASYSSNHKPFTPPSCNRITRRSRSDPTNDKHNEATRLATPKDIESHGNKGAMKNSKGKSKKTPLPANIYDCNVDSSTTSESPIPSSLLASLNSDLSPKTKPAEDKQLSIQSKCPIQKTTGTPKSPGNIHSSPFRKNVDGDSASSSKPDNEVNFEQSTAVKRGRKGPTESGKNHMKPDVVQTSSGALKPEENITSCKTTQDEVCPEKTNTLRSKKQGRPINNKLSECKAKVAKSGTGPQANVLLLEQYDSSVKKRNGRPSMKKEVSIPSIATAGQAVTALSLKRKLPDKCASSSPRRTRSAGSTLSSCRQISASNVTQSPWCDTQSSATASENETQRTVNVTQSGSHGTEEMDVTSSASHSTKEVPIMPSTSQDEEIHSTPALDQPGVEMSVTLETGNPVSTEQAHPSKSPASSSYREDSADLPMAETTSTGSAEAVVPSEKEPPKAPEESITSQVTPDIDEEACITATMEAEEKKIHRQLVKQDKKEQNQEVKEWTDMQETHRFARLQHLLDKSSIYTKFLLTRMEQQKEQQEKREKRQAKRQENKDIKDAAKANQVVRKSSRRKENEQNGDQDVQSVPKVESKSSRGRKRKANPMLSDYITEEALIKRQRLSEQKSPVRSPLSDTSKNTVGSPDQCVPTTPKSTPVTPKKTMHSTEEDSKASNKEDDDQLVQPSLVTGGTLRNYQVEGVNWLRILYENGVNGILADEMGLGKTIQCISLVAYLIEKGVKGPFLVAAPLSTLPNWMSEFHRFTPKIPVILYHGSKDDRARLRHKINRVIKVDSFVTQPVVVTSYEICMNDQKFLSELPWKHMIVDEGHRIKNLNCRLIRELKTYNTSNRLLLTGTPLQNNLQELWSLLNFLLPDIFDELSSFQMLFDFEALEDKEGQQKILAQEKEHQVLERLHAILTPFLLRRLKADVELSLPPKKELLVYAPLTVKQTEFYKAALDKTILNIVGSKKDTQPEAVELTPSGRPKRKSRVNVDYTVFDTEDLDEFSKSMLTLNNMRQSGKSSKKQQQEFEVNVPIMNILMVLRKCCNHPYLLEYPLNPLTGQFKVDQELITSSGKMMILNQLLQGLKERGHKVLIFSQMTKMLDIIEDYCYYQKYKFCRLDGSIKFEDRREQIHDFNTHPEVFIFLLSTRAGGLGLNLSAADTVIIFDSDWNPQADLQAQDRCHRIGQTKPILVYRLVTANTVDQKMVERAACKRKLEKLVIHKGKFKGKIDSNAISAEELKDLLESAHTDHVVTNDSFTLSTNQLNALLDRTDLIKQQKDKVNALKNNNADSALFRVVEDAIDT